MTHPQQAVRDQSSCGYSSSYGWTSTTRACFDWSDNEAVMQRESVHQRQPGSYGNSILQRLNMTPSFFYFQHKSDCYEEVGFPATAQQCNTLERTKVSVVQPLRTVLAAKSGTSQNSSRAPEQAARRTPPGVPDTELKRSKKRISSSRDPKKQ
jgi:hypothetical protein